MQTGAAGRGIEPRRQPLCACQPDAGRLARAVRPEAAWPPLAERGRHRRCTQPAAGWSRGSILREMGSAPHQPAACRNAGAPSDGDAVGTRTNKNMPRATDAGAVQRADGVSIWGGVWA